jgi:enoyl-CoA hydratase/carnithine racemase
MGQVLQVLAKRLELKLRADGTPANPVAVVLLEEWRDAPLADTWRACTMIAGALPITVATLVGPPSPQQEMLMAAATLTLAHDMPRFGPAKTAAEREQLPQTIVHIGDLPGDPDPAGALERLRAAADRSPRAAIACAQLLRQTARLGTGEGLAAEAAAYSMLLGGPEFARWLAERGPRRDRELVAEPLLVSRDGGRLSITLNDPARRNAFSAAVREALLDAVAVALADDTVESVELRGAGPTFCSGGDLDEFGQATDLAAAYLGRLSRAPWRVIDKIAPKVTVFVQGACIGAGVEIAAYADRVIAAPNAFFALPEVGMGLVPGAGGSVSVPRRIGQWRAAWLMLTGDRLPAQTALRWGLVDEVRAAGRSG